MNQNSRVFGLFQGILIKFQGFSREKSYSTAFPGSPGFPGSVVTLI